ncbi:MAG: beta-ketoacyl synthase [Planctomycetaceae bacterium]
MSNDRKVVITGLGLMTPLGLGVEAYWEKLSTGQSGVAPVVLPEHHAIGSPDSIAGEVSDFTESAARKAQLKPLRKMVKVMCREIQLGAASAIDAVDQSGIDLDSIDHTRLGISFGANLMSSPPEVLKDGARACAEMEDGEAVFDFDRWGADGLPAMQPLWLLRYLPNMPACHIGIAIDARGPNNSITVDEASGNLAIAEAVSIIERNAADLMIAGTTGTRVHPVKSSHARLWWELAEEPEDPTKRCRPFELNRAGEVVAEGSASFLLEEKAHAEARGAKIYGHILSTAATCVLDKSGEPQMTEAMAKVMQIALDRAGLKPEDIGHINAHGCGCRQIDKSEAVAIHEVFGDLGSKVPVTAIKSYTGNSGSGCGPMEIAASLLSLAEGIILPTLNYDTPDPDCNLNVVNGEPLATDNKTFLNLNVTHMGQASATIITA